MLENNQNLKCFLGIQKNVLVLRFFFFCIKVKVKETFEVTNHNIFLRIYLLCKHYSLFLYCPLLLYLLPTFFLVVISCKLGIYLQLACPKSREISKASFVSSLFYSPDASRRLEYFVPIILCFVRKNINVLLLITRK